MQAKKASRLRRATRSRAKMKELGMPRLCVNRTPRHIYAQIITGEGDRILATASTLDKELRKGATGNVEAANTQNFLGFVQLACLLILFRQF